MYLDFFGLDKSPFRITPDTQLFFEGCDRGNCLLALCYTVSHEEGITKVVGEVGTGKTMLCRILPLKAENNIDWVYLAHPNLSPSEVLAAIARELGIKPEANSDKSRLTTQIQEQLIQRHSRNRRVVVLVDEAQAMSLESLEEIRLLSNLETDEHKLLQIVLFGQPELDAKLSLPQIRQLRERITHNIQLQPFPLDDLQDYLNFRLRAVGYRGPDLFSSEVTKSILKYSRGLVRRINIIADHVLLAAYVNNRHRVTVADVKNAAREQNYYVPYYRKFLPTRANASLMQLVLLLVMFTGGCSVHQQPDRFETDTRHLNVEKTPTSSQNQNDIPKPVTGIPPSLPPPSNEMNESKHTVVVHDVPVKELLFSLTRDARLNLDIDNNIDAHVTLNAVNQPLSSLLERISELAELRYELRDNNLIIRKDTPFLRSYRIDYLNMDRTSSSRVSVSTQIASTGQGAGAESSGGGGADNSSDTAVQNSSTHNFWQSLQINIAAIIGSPITDRADGGQLAMHPDILFNRESGVLAVRATSVQHREIQDFLSEVSFSSQRQVLIEATIVEVTLSDRYQAGIDWTLLQTNSSGQTEFVGTQFLTDNALIDPVFSVTHIGDDLTATLKALSTFGDISVMSSPKIMALNNQTALLKVVDNLVYFTVDVTVENGTQGSPTLYTYETDINTVPIGFVMSVTPYISEFDNVTLNIRPTISRVIGQERDPNPALAAADVVSEIPVIQVREVESILKIPNGEIAVIGGLMQDEQDNNNSSVPMISRIPFVGKLFSYEDKLVKKSELVILIKPVVIKSRQDLSISSRSPGSEIFR